MTELKRSLGLGQATAMVVGIIIGASIFVQPSEIARLVTIGAWRLYRIDGRWGTDALCGALLRRARVRVSAHGWRVRLS